MTTVYILTVTVATVVKHVPACHEACSPFCLLSLRLLFQDFPLTCAGVSVSFIGCPSNLNLICLISSPYREKRTLVINWPSQFYLHFGCSYSNRFHCKWYIHGILSKYVFRECLQTFKSHGEIGALSPVVKEKTPGSYCGFKNELHNRHLIPQVENVNITTKIHFFQNNFSCESDRGFPDLTISTAQLSSQCSLRRKSRE